MTVSINLHFEMDSPDFRGDFNGATASTLEAVARKIRRGDIPHGGDMIQDSDQTVIGSWSFSDTAGG